MNRVVVDASAVAKWFFEERFTPQAIGLLSEEYRLFAPDLLLVEMDNLFCKRIWRGDIDEAAAAKMRRTLRRAPIHLTPFGELEDSTFALACELQSSYYDSLYLALAKALQAKLVTADSMFYANGRKHRDADSICWIGDLKSGL